MIFSSKAARQAMRALGGALEGDSGGSGASPWRILGLGALCLGLLTACGGSTSQLDPFVPQRFLVFGDDSSALDSTGRKYGVNSLDANGNLVCASEPLWVQQLAAAYGFEFAQCNPTYIEPKGIMLARAGARVADVTAQVDQQLAAGGFRDKDMATVLAGANDILDLYAQYPGRSVDSLVAEAGDRGAQLAAVVNRLVGLGVKVIVSDLPDLGLSPFAIAQKGFDPTGLDRAALISQLGQAFSLQLGVKIILDGRFVGLVQTQLRFQAIGIAPASFGLTNITDAICTVPLPNCSSNTLVSGGVTTAYLWADDTHLSTGGHNQLATLALDRARRNPF